jgi:putative serine protease PepD
MPRFDPDDEESRPVPHPLDRTWIHPSELGAGRVGTQPGPVAAPSRARRPWRRDALLAVAAGTVGAVATVTVLGLAGAFEPGPARVPKAAASTPAPTDAATVATRVAPGIGAVVTALGTQDERRGSGIVVGPHEVLTTSDVVAPAAMGVPVRVLVGDGEPLVATVHAVDGLTGLALVEVPDRELQPARMTGSPSVRAGDWIVVVGRTPTNGPWVSSGVVTATGGWTRDAQGNSHPGLISTNTELSDDARGGALVDAGGHIVGILAMVNAGSERAVAMPAEFATDVATQLATQGHATHGTLGLRAADATGGPVIVSVDDGSAAARAGLREEDRVVAIDSTRTPDTATLVYELRRRQAGTRAVLEVQRNGRRLRVAVTLDDAGAETTGATTLALDSTGG